jgi:hypothetical protein
MTEPYRIRSAQTWVLARDDYLAGMGAEAVCRRHDLGLSAFRRRARKHGWRRVDQDDPPPGDLDLSIYDDINADDQADMARLRFIQALNQGKSTEAARWRRLWLELRDTIDAFDAELFPGQTRAQISALVAAELPGDQSGDEDEVLALAPPASRLAAPVPTATLENVHDVHAIFSGDTPAVAATTGVSPPPAGP